MPRTFTVMGATGNVGQRVANVLLSHGHSVRALVRALDSSSSTELKNAGAELFASGFVAGTSPLGSLHADESCLVSAFSNVDGIFILVPPNVMSPHPDEEVQAYIELIKGAVQKAENVRKLVFLSSWGAQHASGTGNIVTVHHLEQAFAPLAGPQLNIVFVRAGSFFPNILPRLRSVPSGIFMGSNSPNLVISMVSTDDIGDEVAKRLVETQRECEPNSPVIVELAGPEDYTFAQITEMISSIVGKQIEYQKQPAESIVPSLVSYGMPQRGAELVAGVSNGIEDGTVAYEHPESLVRGTRHLKDFLIANLP